jgi:phosphoribosyl-ATP pyrophosphohydrolase
MTFFNKNPARVNSPRSDAGNKNPARVNSPRSDAGLLAEDIVTTPPKPSIFQQLMDVIRDRKARPPERSYTTSLFAGGVEKIGAKLEEEAAEVVEAAGEAGDGGREHLVREAADLVYHLFVMLGYRDVSLGEVEAELARRFGISGLDEKAARDEGHG